ncbi:MAG: AbgT family transporter [Cetobacterium sp.]|uniref:AbgT family transporter n=1 Tax=Cetobacterium sp. ZOR0034 TaxID=1339239 RepID=UPI000648E452|nr:AbgT family transporter [Cetobacterium sp. ZOR0034]
MKKTNDKKDFFIKYLDKVEKVGNSLPHPASIFFILTLIVAIASMLATKAGIQVTYEVFDAKQQQMVESTVKAINILSVDGIRFMIPKVVSNFTSFFALGTVFTVMLGVGVAEGTGLLSTLLRKAAHSTHSRALAYVVVFLGIISNVASSAGYVVLVPLGAVLFMSFKRHPIAGLAATFAGVSGGWSANILLGTNDPVFAGLSTQAMAMINPNYVVHPTGNWYISIASTILITFIGGFITEKIVEPRLPAYDYSKFIHSDSITSEEEKGTKWALTSLVIYIFIVLMMLLPQNSILRNPQTGAIMQSPFMSGIIFFMMLFFLIPGIAFGIGANKIKNDKDIINLMIKSISGLSGFFVLIFFAAQFVAFFTYSNLGTIISVKGAELLQRTGFVGLPLIISFIAFTAFINIFMAVDTAKWALMAPIFVPMFYKVGLSPELTQMAYRIGDSSTNIVSPLMPFFPLIVAFAQKYDEESGMGTLVSTMLPYSLAFLIGWSLLLAVWYMLGLPLGPGALPLV